MESGCPNDPLAGVLKDDAYRSVGVQRLLVQFHPPKLDFPAALGLVIVRRNQFRR